MIRFVVSILMDSPLYFSYKVAIRWSMVQAMVTKLQEKGINYA